MKFAVESGDVKLSETFPNQDVPTGHSCFVTAEARDIIVTVEMVNTNDELDSLFINYEEKQKMAFLSGTYVRVSVQNNKPLTSCR